MNLHYLTTEEERAIKANIPWEFVDQRALELVRVANKIEGVATVQSCAGHISPTDEGFYIRSASLAFRLSEARTHQILFNAAPSVGITDIEIRYFEDGTFWLNLIVHPTEHFKFFELFEALSVEVVH